GRLHYASMRKTVVNSFELSADKMAGEVVALCERVRPRVIVGFANALYETARCLEERAVSVRPPLGIVSAAEKLFPHQRETIERAFRAPVYDRYGCREVMIIGAECSEHSGLHVAADNLYVEIARDGRPCGPGEPG